jgi:hypothetical protein
MHKNLLCFVSENAKQFREWVEEAINHALFERNDGVVGDRDTFWAHLSTTLGDIAQADAELFPQLWGAIAHIQGVHFQRGRVNEEPWSNELFVHLMIAQYVANILAEIAFDALAKFLHPVNVALGYAPCAIRRIGSPWLEFRDAPLYLVIP